MTPQFLQQTIKQYALLNDWYLSVLDGISDDHGNKVINDLTNSLEWISGHLIAGRYRNILRMGQHLELYAHLDKFVNPGIPPPNAIAFSRQIPYAHLSENRMQWTRYGETLLSALHSVTDDVLDKQLPFSIPIDGNTVADALSFVALHESYHIGQMSLIRKSLGYGAMVLGRRK